MSVRNSIKKPKIRLVQVSGLHFVAPRNTQTGAFWGDVLTLGLFGFKQWPTLQDSILRATTLQDTFIYTTEV